YAVWLYAERCGEWERVRADWPRLKAVFDDFVKAGWKLDGDRGDLHANRYLASLLAFAKIARKADDADSARRAEALADATAETLAAWWRRAAENAAAPVVPSIKEWDQFIGRGDALFFAVAPHRAKLALFHEMTPEVAAVVRAKAPEALDR